MSTRTQKLVLYNQLKLKLHTRMPRRPPPPGPPTSYALLRPIPSRSGRMVISPEIPPASKTPPKTLLPPSSEKWRLNTDDLTGHVLKRGLDSEKVVKALLPITPVTLLIFPSSSPGTATRTTHKSRSAWASRTLKTNMMKSMALPQRSRAKKNDVVKKNRCLPFQ